MTRHELKEQLQHDAFRDNAGAVAGYVSTHQRQTIRYVVIALVVILVVGAGYGIYRYQKSQREQALASAMSIAEAPVQEKSDGFGLSFKTEADRVKAATKALSDVAARYSGTEQGDAAQLYLGGLAASDQKFTEAEKAFKAVADSHSPVADLGKIGLAQLYLGQGKTQEAKALLEKLLASPGALVSKEQATVLLATAIQQQDPKRSKQLLDGLKSSRPSVERAVTQLGQETR